MSENLLNPVTVCGVDSNDNVQAIKIEEGRLAVTLGASAGDPIAAVIAADETLSGVVDLGSARAGALRIPTGWTASEITFQGSLDGTNFFDIHDAAGAELVVTPVEETLLVLPATSLRPFQYLKLRSGTSDTPVAHDEEMSILIGLTQ